MYSNDTKRKWGRKSLACLKHLCNPSGDGILSLSVGPWDIFYNEKKSKEFFWLKEAQHLCVCIGCHLSCWNGVRNFLMFNNNNNNNNKFKLVCLFIYNDLFVGVEGEMINLSLLECQKMFNKK
jgi:hypothetical protein